MDVHLLEIVLWDFGFGESLQGPRLNLGLGIARCAMVTIDPDTAERDPSMLRTVAQHFGNEIGAYGTVETQGEIAVGDRVRLIRPTDPA